MALGEIGAIGLPLSLPHAENQSKRKADQRKIDRLSRKNEKQKFQRSNLAMMPTANMITITPRQPPESAGSLPTNSTII